MTFNTKSKELEEVLSDLEVSTSEGWVIMLYNDDVNTFDWVIENLIKYCNHNKIQAEQCALIVHTRGKHAVKYGDLQELAPICQTLADCGLSVKLENNE